MMDGTDRCPNCGALVTEDAEWCTLCFTSLLPEPEPEPEPERVADPTPDVDAGAEATSQSASDVLRINLDVEGAAPATPHDAPGAQGAGTPTPAERNAIDQRPTRSLAAFLASLLDSLDAFIAGRGF
jgi:hypothetical protein